MQLKINLLTRAMYFRRFIMIRLENAEVIGWEHAVRGMRNPMNSWAKSDSAFYSDYIKYGECPAYGKTKEMMEKSIIGKPSGLSAFPFQRPSCQNSRLMKCPNFVFSR